MARTTRTQLERYRFIDTLFSTGGAMDFAAILAALAEHGAHISASSLRRDLRYMRDVLGAPIAYSAERGGWHYTRAFMFPADGLGESEAVLIELMSRVLSQHESRDVIHQSFRRLLEKLKPAELPSALAERVYVPPRCAPQLDEGVSEKIVRALKENRMLDFCYSSKWEKDEPHRKILPYQLIIDEGSLYLYGASSRAKDKPRLFNASKMHCVPK